MLESIGAVIGVLVGVLGMVATVYQVFSKFGERKFKKFEVFNEIKTLWNVGGEGYLVSVVVGFQCFTKCDLTLNEIKWFLSAPGAFYHLSGYGKNKKYLYIDTYKNCFEYREEFDSIGKRRKKMGFYLFWKLFRHRSNSPMK